MKKILAAIIKYKLDKNDLIPLVQTIIKELNSNNNHYPALFKEKLLEQIKEINDIYCNEVRSIHDEECVMDALKEMEILIVDYLSMVSVN